MTTTEWVDRYNRAFRLAGEPEEQCWETTPCNAEDDGPMCLDLTGKEKLFEWLGAPSREEVKRQQARTGEVLRRPLPVDPSHFKAPPYFDPQATDQRALKRKETP